MLLALATALLAGGGTNLILAISSLGGLSGLAAVISVIVTYKNNRAKEKTDVRSIAIQELEKAIPGMGNIITEWQEIVQQLQKDLAECRARVLELEHQAQGHA